MLGSKLVSLLHTVGNAVVEFDLLALIPLLATRASVANSSSRSTCHLFPLFSNTCTLFFKPSNSLFAAENFVSAASAFFDAFSA